MEYTCEHCGETRFFYVEVSIKAKQRIDLRNGARNKKVYDIDPNQIDGFYEDVIYCGKCNQQVDMDGWDEYSFG